MPDLRTKVIRLAHANPNLRPHLLRALVGRTRSEATVRDLQISLEVATGYLDTLSRGDARGIALAARHHVAEALKIVQGPLTEAVTPGFEEQLPAWLH